MRAVAVYPGKPDSIHLADLPKPKVEDVPGGRGVLVAVFAFAALARRSNLSAPGNKPGQTIY